MVSGSKDKKINIWNPQTGDLVFSLQDPCGISSLLSIDNYKLATGTYCGKIVIWNLKNKSIITNLNVQRKAITNIKLLNDSILAASSLDDSISLWNVNNNNFSLLRKLSEKSRVDSLEFIFNSNLLATGLYSGLINIWNTYSGTKVQTLNHGAGVYSLLLLKDNTTLVSGDFSINIIMWNINTWNKIASFSPGAFRLIYLNSNTLAYSNWSLTKYGIYTLDLNKNITEKFISNSFYSAIKLINNDLLALANQDDFKIEIWNLTDMNIIFELVGHNNSIYGLDLIKID